MTKRIIILVGTMSGTAEMAADEMAARIEALGGTAKVVRMEKATPAALAAGGTFIFCSSTYGTGEVPDNAKAFYGALQKEKPDLSKVSYGVVALGDSVYSETFCGGGRSFDSLLTSLSAKRIGERLEHDRRSSVFPEDLAGAWVQEWFKRVLAEEVR